MEKQTTAHKITGQGGSIQIQARGNCPQKHQVPWGTKTKTEKKGKGKGKGKEKAQESANVLDISGLLELSITSSKSINFSCYKMSEKVEWYLDSDSTEHITPDKSDFVEYREFSQAENAEITDGKFLKIEGYRTIIGHSIMLNGMALMQI